MIHELPVLVVSVHTNAPFVACDGPKNESEGAIKARRIFGHFHVPEQLKVGPGHSQDKTTQGHMCNERWQADGGHHALGPC